MVEITRISTKGQIVIPRRIRDKFELEEGNVLSVMESDDAIVLRKIESSKVKSWEEATKPFRDASKKSGFTQEDLFKIIAESRLNSKRN